MTARVWTHKAGIIGRDDCAMFPVGWLPPGVVKAFLAELNALEVEVDACRERALILSAEKRKELLQ